MCGHERHIHFFIIIWGYTVTERALYVNVLFLFFGYSVQFVSVRQLLFPAPSDFFFPLLFLHCGSHLCIRSIQPNISKKKKLNSSLSGDIEYQIIGAKFKKMDVFFLFLAKIVAVYT